MVGWIIALISGALMSIQGVFNTNLTKQTSIWVANSWVQLTGFLVCIVFWFFSGKDSFGGLLQVKDKYVMLGGVIGAFITYTVIRSMADLGPAHAVMLILIAQMLIAYFIEVFGLFGVEKVDFHWSKAIGTAIIISGIIIFKWKE